MFSALLGALILYWIVASVVGLVKYFIKRRSAAKTNSAPPKFPVLAILCVILFISCIAFGIAMELMPPSTVAATQRPISTATYYAYLTATPRPNPTSTPYVDTLRPITWMELQDFLAKDHTNWNEFTDKYVCVNFAMDLFANANKQNINAWIVSVSFEGAPVGHTFVAFETTDKGIVWIDPQSDYSYRVVDVGNHLCSAVVDTNICDLGVITEIIQPAECNAVTHECWAR